MISTGGPRSPGLPADVATGRRGRRALEGGQPGQNLHVENVELVPLSKMSDQEGRARGRLTRPTRSSEASQRLHSHDIGLGGSEANGAERTPLRLPAPSTAWQRRTYQ